MSYLYYANFAVAIGEGEITGLGRIWADGEEWDLSTITHRVYFGTQDQAPDPFIEAKLGAGETPAYRGTAYIVFERLALEPFGNRLPQSRSRCSVPSTISRTMARRRHHSGIRRICLCNRAGTARSFAVNIWPRTYIPAKRRRIGRHHDQIARTLPNVQSASLMACWFGADLRAGNCLVRPGVERAER